MHRGTIDLDHSFDTERRILESIELAARRAHMYPLADEIKKLLSERYKEGPQLLNEYTPPWANMTPENKE